MIAAAPRPKTTRRPAGTLLTLNRAAEFDLLSMVQGDAGPGKHSNGTWMFRCPAGDHHDNTPSFALRFKGDRWVWHCHGCNRNGDTAEYLVLTGRAVDQNDGLRWLREQAGDYQPIRAAFPVPTPEQKAEPMAPTEPAPAADKLLDRFLEQRGLTRWAADTYQLTPIVDTYGGIRIRFPWFNSKGELVFCQDRAMGNAKTRWLSPQGRSCPRPFGMELLATLDDMKASGDPYDRGDDLFITEGLTDCVTLTDAMQADMGTSATVAVGLIGGQIKRTWDDLFSGLNVYVITDSDAPGQTKRAEIVEHLSKAASVTHVHVPAPWKDLSEWRVSTTDQFHEQFMNTLADAMGKAL